MAGNFVGWSSTVRPANVTFTTTAKNDGRIDSQWVEITLPVPDSLEFVSSNPPAEPQQGRLVFVATVINGGTHPVTLVEPGDGSESGWRTPVITWKVTTPDGKLVPRQEYSRCGNMNAISDNEIFTLAAGERRVLNEWLGEPAVAPGHYIVRLVYDNDPSRKERGLSLGETRRDVAARLRKSTPCKVESGPVIADLAGP